jgi:hypothetical protein
MARLAHTVVSGISHHVTQHGNRREAIFFEDGDQEVYFEPPKVVIWRGHRDFPVPVGAYDFCPIAQPQEAC